MIQLISRSFLASHMCLFEVGAAWVLDSSTYPIIVPPLDRKGVIEYLGDTHTGFMGTEVEVEEQGMAF